LATIQKASVCDSTCISTLVLCERLYVYVFCTRHHSLLIVSCVCILAGGRLSTNKYIKPY